MARIPQSARSSSIVPSHWIASLQNCHLGVWMGLSKPTYGSPRHVAGGTVRVKTVRLHPADKEFFVHAGKEGEEGSAYGLIVWTWCGLLLLGSRISGSASAEGTMRSCQLLQLRTASPSALGLLTSPARVVLVNSAPQLVPRPRAYLSRRKSFQLYVQKELGRWTSTLRMSAKAPGSDNGKNGLPHIPRKGADFFVEEAIGAEHGEGFATYRPRGPLHVDVDYLNDRMRERGLQRIRYAMKPDEAFGLIYSWDNVIADTRGLMMEAWNRLAEEEGKVIGNESHRQLLTMTPTRVLEKVLYWGETGGDIERLTKRLAVLYSEALARVRTPVEGVKEWLEALDTAGVPCAVASSLDRLTLLAALERMGLRKHFQAVVSEEDGMESIAHRFLSAAVKLDRPPFKCVVFEDDPRGITAAHNCTMKAVALIGSHPAYDLTQADLAVSSFTELSVINLRRLFANKGTEFMDLQKQPEEKKPRKRKITNDTLF